MEITIPMEAIYEVDAKKQQLTLNNYVLGQEHDRLYGHKYTGFVFGRKFYRCFKKKNDETPTIERDYPSTTSTIIACDNQTVNRLTGELNEGIKKIYTVFNSLPEVFNYTVLKTAKEKDTRTYYEVLKDHRKIYFDIDMNDNLEHCNLLIQYLLDGIQIELKKVDPAFENKNNTLVFTSHNDKKKSFHIIVDNYYHEHYSNTRAFYRLIKEYVPPIYRQYLDESVYTKNRCFRLYCSHKLNTDRTKIYDDSFLKRGLDLKDRQAIFNSSLISNTSYCTLLPDYCLPKEHKEYNTEFTREEWDIISDLWSDFEHKDQYEFNCGDVRLKRITSGYCECHKRHHGDHSQKGNGGVLSLYNGSIYLHCFAKRDSDEGINPNIHLGFLNKVPEKEYEDKNFIDFVNDESSEEEYVPIRPKHIELICGVIDKDIAHVCEDIITNIVCVDKKKGIFYCYDEDTALWVETCDIYHEISNPLIALCDKYVLEYKKLSFTEQEKEEITLKKMNKARKEFGKYPFLVRIVALYKSLIYDGSFKDKLNKTFTNLLPINDNLVIDLKTGVTELRLKTHYFSHYCNVSYGNLMVDHSKDVEKFFLDIAGGDVDLCQFYQTILGLCLTGEIIKHIIVFYGEGNNGKSCMMNILSNVLGFLYKPLNDHIFVKAKGSSSANSHTAHLEGVINSRVGISSELDDNENFNIPLLNKLVGKDIIEHRPCGQQNTIEFKSSCKLILVTNDIPKFPPKKKAFIQRLLPIPFPVKFIDLKKSKKSESSLKPNQRKQDTQLATKMEKDPFYLNDVFKWMVQGSINYYINDLILPSSVKSFKNKCLYENDDLLQLIQENIEKDDNASIKISDLFTRVSNKKSSPWNIKKFKEDIETKDYTIEKNKDTYYLIGYKLTPNDNTLQVLAQTETRILSMRK